MSEDAAEVARLEQAFVDQWHKGVAGIMEAIREAGQAVMDARWNGEDCS